MKISKFDNINRFEILYNKLGYILYLSYDDQLYFSSSSSDAQNNLQPKSKEAFLIGKLKYALMMDALLHFPFAF